MEAMSEQKTFSRRQALFALLSPMAGSDALAQTPAYPPGDPALAAANSGFMISPEW